MRHFTNHKCYFEKCYFIYNTLTEIISQLQKFAKCDTDTRTIALRSFFVKLTPCRKFFWKSPCIVRIVSYQFATTSHSNWLISPDEGKHVMSHKDSHIISFAFPVEYHTLLIRNSVMNERQLSQHFELENVPSLRTLTTTKRKPSRSSFAFYPPSSMCPSHSRSVIKI